MKRAANRLTLPFIGAQCFIWSGIAFYYPFFVPYLKNAGYSEISIGIATSALSLVGIAGPILWGAVLDRLKSAKWLIVINLLCGCLAMQLIPLAVRHFSTLIVVLTAVNLTVFPMTTILDSWIMRLKAGGAPVNYGLSRGSGSLAYAMVSTAAGVILTRVGLSWMFAFMLGVECFTAACVLLVRENREARLQAGAGVDLDEPEAPPLHRNRPFLVYTLLATLLYTGLSGAQNFFWILLQGAGGTPADMGLAMGVCALSEFPVMFLSSRLLRRFRDTSLLVFSMGFYAVRILLFFAMHSVAGLICAQLTNSLSYAIFLPTSMHYISRITPQRTRAVAFSIAVSVTMGLGGIFGNLAGGFVIAAWGARTLYAASGALVLAVTAAFGMVLLFSRRARPDLPEPRPPSLSL